MSSDPFISQPVTQPVTKLLTASLEDFGIFGVALIIEGHDVPLQEPVSITRSKYRQCARELRPHELRKMATYIATNYPDLFKTVLTCCLDR